MPQMKVEFAPQQAQASPFQRQPSFNQKNLTQNAFYPEFASTLGQRHCSSYKNVFAAQPTCAQQAGMINLPLDKVPQVCGESSSPMTQSTGASSQCDTHSSFSDEDGLDCLEMGAGFESPVHHHCHSHMVRRQSQMTCNAKASNVKTENGWKKKVKTELCRFWLNGQECENSKKEQGCGFAHG